MMEMDIVTDSRGLFSHLIPTKRPDLLLVYEETKFIKSLRFVSLDPTVKQKDLPYTRIQGMAAAPQHPLVGIVHDYGLTILDYAKLAVVRKLELKTTANELSGTIAWSSTGILAITSQEVDEGAIMSEKNWIHLFDHTGHQIAQRYDTRHIGHLSWSPQGIMLAVESIPNEDSILLDTELVYRGRQNGVCNFRYGPLPGQYAGWEYLNGGWNLVISKSYKPNDHFALRRFMGIDHRSLGDIVWSPDGQKLLVQVIENDVPSTFICNLDWVHWFSLDEILSTTPVVGRLQWLADSSGLVFIGDGGKTINRLTV